MNGYICPVCRGTGLLSFICNEEEKDEPGFIPIFDFESCCICNGLGYEEENK